MPVPESVCPFTKEWFVVSEALANVSKLIGDTCRFSAECVSGACNAIDGCSGLNGSCICDGDNDCTTAQYCGWGLNAGSCQNKKARGALCSTGRECLSGRCSWLTCT